MEPATLAAAPAAALVNATGQAAGQTPATAAAATPFAALLSVPAGAAATPAPASGSSAGGEMLPWGGNRLPPRRVTLNPADPAALPFCPLVPGIANVVAAADGAEVPVTGMAPTLPAVPMPVPLLPGTPESGVTPVPGSASSLPAAPDRSVTVESSAADVTVVGTADRANAELLALEPVPSAVVPATVAASVPPVATALPRSNPAASPQTPTDTETPGTMPIEGATLVDAVRATGDSAAVDHERASTRDPGLSGESLPRFAMTDNAQRLDLARIDAPASGDVQSSGPLPAQGSIDSDVGTQRWERELGQRLIGLVEKGVNEVRLRLHPEHLGPLEIRISVQDSQVGVWLNAQHADTRDALEHALPRLREMLAQGGMTMADASISQQRGDHGAHAPPERDVAAYGHRAEARMPDAGFLRDRPRDLEARLLDVYA